jgi:Cu-Zn family superoxide dismutase
MTKIIKKYSARVVVLTVALYAFTTQAAFSMSGVFIDTTGKQIGTLSLKEMKSGTLITVDVKLPEGVHAMHIHEHGVCDAPKFETAGGHLNPEDKEHGVLSHQGHHLGDLPNLYVESTGHVKMEAFAPYFLLSDRLLLEKGISFIIHEKADDHNTNPSGNSGDRHACAVIKQ